MTEIKQILVFACIIVSVAMISGCTMSDSDVQSYIDSHPDEINAYVSSHGEMISSYLAEHPEILEAIELPEATATLAVEPQTYNVEVTETQSSPTESPTIVIQSTTAISTETQTPTPTATDTPEVTTVPTTEPTTTSTIPETMVTQTETTPIPTTTITTIPTTTTIATTIPTTEPTPIPTPTPYLSLITGLPAIIDFNGPWYLVSNQQGISATMMASTNANNIYSTSNSPFSGTATIKGMANDASIKRADGNSVGVGSQRGTDFSFSFNWVDNLDGTYTTSAIESPLDWSDKMPRTITYSKVSDTKEELHFSGWPEGTYLTRG